MAQPIVQIYDIDAFIRRELSEFLCCAYAQGKGDIVAASKSHRGALAARAEGRAHPSFPYLSRHGWPDEKQIRSAIEQAQILASEDSKPMLEFLGQMAAIFCGIGRVAAAPGVRKPRRAGKLDDGAPPRRARIRSIVAEDFAGPPFPDRRNPAVDERRTPERGPQNEQLNRAIRALQQNTLALEAEIARRKDAEKKLDRLMAHQERMVEEERKRIARELHDDLGALLTGIGAYMSVALARAEREGKKPEQELVVASELTGLAVETVRRVVTELRPSVLDNLGLWSSLEWYAGQIQERTNLKCECSIDPALRDFEPDADLGTALFRIVQEALTNATRHAGASRVSIRVARDEHIAIVEIEDDGIGIDTDRLLGRDSFGIAGMYERARQFGGDIKIAGVKGQGTVVALRFKMQYPAPAQDARDAESDSAS